MKVCLLLIGVCLQWAFVSGSGSSVSGEVGLDQSQGPKEIELWHF